MFLANYLDENRSMIISAKDDIFGHHKSKMRLDTFWVNYQRSQFNPIHNHNGVLSFVAWMKIPTEVDGAVTKELPISANSNTPSASDFMLAYTNILGSIVAQPIEMGKANENAMLVFLQPCNIKRYIPFYNCSEDRISVSTKIF